MISRVLQLQPKNARLWKLGLSNCMNGWWDGTALEPLKSLEKHRWLSLEWCDCDLWCHCSDLDLICLALTAKNTKCRVLWSCPINRNDYLMAILTCNWQTLSKAFTQKASDESGFLLIGLNVTFYLEHWSDLDLIFCVDWMPIPTRLYMNRVGLYSCISTYYCTL